MLPPNFNVRESFLARHAGGTLTSQRLRRLLFSESQTRFAQLGEQLKALPIEIEGLSFGIERSPNFGVSVGEANDVKMTLGSVLAIDDFVSGVLLLPTVFAFPETDELPAAAFEVNILDDFNPSRFRSYAAALANRAPRSEDLAFAKHETPWRLAQADLIAKITLDYVLLHELAHVVLGHISRIVDDDAPRSERRLVEFESSGTPGSPLRRASELEADAVAFQMLRELIVRDETYAPFEHFRFNISTRPPDAGSILGDMGAAGRYHVALLAAGLSMFLVENLESSVDEPLPLDARAHPPSGVRLANIIYTAFLDGLRQFLAEDEDGRVKWDIAVDEPDLKEMLRKIVQPISAALLDLEKVSELFASGESLLLDASDSAPRASLQLVQSIFHGFDPDVPPENIAVPAIADLIRYEPQRKVLKALAMNDDVERLVRWLEECPQFM